MREQPSHVGEFADWGLIEFSSWKNRMNHEN